MNFFIELNNTVSFTQFEPRQFLNDGNFVVVKGFFAGKGNATEKPSIFITLLAFDNADIVNNSKIAILIASLIAGAIGFLWLRMTLKTQIEND